MSENEATTDELPPEKPAVTQKNDLELLLNILTKVLPFAFLVIVFGYYAATADHFTDSRNIENMLQQAAYLGFIAVGINAVMLYGELDLSAIGLVGLCSYVFVDTVNGGSEFGAIILALLIAGVFGVLHGLLVGGLRTNGALTTIATALVATALALNASDGRPLVMESDGLGIFTDKVGSVSVMLIVLIVLVLILDGVRFGLKMAFAENPPKIPGWLWALMILLLAYTFSGVMIGIGSAAFTTRLRASFISGGNTTMVFNALAAVVIGGTVPSGKFGWFLGTVAATIGIAALINGLVLKAAEVYTQNLYVGVLLVVWLCLHAGIKLILDYNQPSTQTTDS